MVIVGDAGLDLAVSISCCGSVYLGQQRVCSQNRLYINGDMIKACHTLKWCLRAQELRSVDRFCWGNMLEGYEFCLDRWRVLLSLYREPPRRCRTRPFSGRRVAILGLGLAVGYLGGFQPDL